MPLEFTPAAVDRGRELLAEKGAQWLRIGIRGGGCSGLEYFMDYLPEPGEGDKRFDHGGLRVCVDKKSYLFLNGVQIDYAVSLVKNGFVFHNPAAKRSCSCGESFTL
jgi:iron-sulfur cluster assembly protein